MSFKELLRVWLLAATTDQLQLALNSGISYQCWFARSLLGPAGEAANGLGR